jgi:hypothetical protein
MLRESSIAYGYDLNHGSIADPSIPIGVPGGNTLLRFVDAAIGRSDEPLGDSHNAIIEELGPEALVDAAAVFGNFEMMNRIAEGTGIPLTHQLLKREERLITDLGIDNLMRE